MQYLFSIKNLHQVPTNIITIKVNQPNWKDINQLYI